LPSHFFDLLSYLNNSLFPLQLVSCSWWL
jgi:hypothetical protein